MSLFYKCISPLDSELLSGSHQGTFSFIRFIVYEVPNMQPVHNIVSIKLNTDKKQSHQKNTQKVILPTQEGRESVGSKESVEPEPLRGKVFTTHKTVRRTIQAEQTMEAKAQYMKRPSAFANNMDFSFISAFI